MTVFVSYKAEDRNRVAPLVEALEADGLPVWWDAHIGGGDDWRETILHHWRRRVASSSSGARVPPGRMASSFATKPRARFAAAPIFLSASTRSSRHSASAKHKRLDLQGWNGDRNDPPLQSDPCRNSGPARHGPITKAGRWHALGRDAANRRCGRRRCCSCRHRDRSWLLVRPGAASSDSIAVLPFANLSGDPSPSLFFRWNRRGAAQCSIPDRRADGRRPHVVGSSSRRRREGRGPETGRRQYPDRKRSPLPGYGSDQRPAGRWPQGVERWSEIYDRPAGDALQIQTDIANKVAEAMSIHLGGADRSRLREAAPRMRKLTTYLLKAQAARASKARAVKHGSGGLACSTPHSRLIRTTPRPWPPKLGC